MAAFADFPGGGEVDSKRLLGEQIFARLEHIEIERLVKVVRDGDIDRIDVRTGELLGVVGGQKSDRWNPTEPFPQGSSRSQTAVSSARTGKIIGSMNQRPRALATRSPWGGLR